MMGKVFFLILMQFNNFKKKYKTTKKMLTKIIQAMKAIKSNR